MQNSSACAAEEYYKNDYPDEIDSSESSGKRPNPRYTVLHHVLSFKTNSMKIQSMQSMICNISLTTTERLPNFHLHTSHRIYLFLAIHYRHNIYQPSTPRIVSLHLYS